MSLLEKMSDESKDQNDSLENTCVVCFKNVEIFSIGECDHPVCYECSTRMRVLCQQNECPICRQGLSKVIFTSEKRPYRELEANNRSEYYNKKYKICFANIQIQKAFYNLLDHPCPKCKCPPFRSFDTLKEHVRKEHEMFYCDICTEHLKIFSFERKCYTRPELGLHRRKGDPDNTSHRGHPLCQYCDCRYVDRDELFRHLRREHYFCHFCDADGSNQFYSDYDSLREHFRNEHYLCEEGDCVREQFTAVFRTDIDLRAHIANVHGKSLGKLQAKQARTLQLDITIGPRGRSAQQEQSIASLRSRGNEELNEMDVIGASAPIVQNPQRVIDAQNEQEFPCLGGAPNNAAAATFIRPTMSIRTKTYGPAGLARTKENFPALGSGGDGGGSLDAASGSKYNQAPVSAILKNHVSQQKGSSASSMVIHVSNRPSSANNPSNSYTGKKLPYKNDFPALPGTSKSQINLREDFIPSNPVNLSSVSAKHRQLVDDYVSVGNPQSNPKITVVQKETIKVPKKGEQPRNVPKLSINDFPALTEAATVPEMSWVKSQKQQDAENRKSKVAPPPLLNGFENLNRKVQERKEQLRNSKSSSDTENNNNQNKKDKKQLKVSEKKENEVKKSESAGRVDTKQNNKSAKEKKVDNNNENKSTIKNKINEKKSNGNNFNNFDFPMLENSTSNLPPPGFDMKVNCAKPPPGFQNVTLNSVAKPKNNLTFTSSLGESYSIYPTHKYLPPPNCAKRNQELVSHFQNTLKSSEAVEEFRHISKLFREGMCKPAAYYEHCQAALGEKFDEIFPELLALLPDINKQQDLYLIYSQNIKQMSKNKKTQGQGTKMEVCTVCKQVLKAADIKAHNKAHSMDNNFPVLQDVDNIISSGRRK